MNSQQEYEQFIAKFFKAVHDVKDDYSTLSQETQLRIAYEAQDVEALRLCNDH